MAESKEKQCARCDNKKCRCRECRGTKNSCSTSGCGWSNIDICFYIRDKDKEKENKK